MLLQRKNDSREASSRSLMRNTPVRRRGVRVALEAEEELRADQHERQRLFDARIEAAALLPLGLIEADQPVDARRR